MLTTLQCGSPQARQAGLGCAGGRELIDDCGGGATPRPAYGVVQETVTATGQRSGATYLGTTCEPENLPGSPQRPQLTIAMIRRAFIDTPFAKPQLTLQPVGNRTLVTLPVFFEIGWPATGFQPGEVRTVSLLGHRVRIKPTFQTHSYHFGDGTSSGPTPDYGGPYPDGKVTHPYPKQGRYQVGATSTYGGEFSVDGGPWMRVPGNVTITGPAQSLQVLTAKNRLVQGDEDD